MALNPNQMQFTSYHSQANAMIERLKKKFTVNYILRSFELEYNHENLEGKVHITFDYFLQSTTWVILEAPNTQHCRQNLTNLCL
jgi:hypothetical protein